MSPIPADQAHAMARTEATGRGAHRSTVAIAVVAAASIAAFLWIPARAVGSSTRHQRTLVHDTTTAVVDSWNSGTTTAALDDLVGQWRAYHAIKALAAAALALSCIALARGLWRSSARRSGRTRRLPTRAAASASMGAGTFAVLLAIANVQGAVAPLASLLSLLPVARGPEALEQVSTQMGAALQSYEATGVRLPSTLGLVVDDFVRFHAALAVMAGLLVAALIAVAVISWRRRSTDVARRPADRPHRTIAIACALGILPVVLIAAANVSTAVDPAPALRAFLSA